MKIRSLSVDYSIKKSREEREASIKLEKDIQNLENLLSSSPSESIQSALYDKKIELEKSREKKIEGLLLRARANWHENGEKCSQYFCKLEKKNFIKKTMVDMIDNQGNHVSDQKKILSKIQNFYKNLYSERKTDQVDESFFIHNVKLTHDQRDQCEGNLLYDECSYALKNMENGKSPGSDGFTVNFYKFFWKDLGPFVYRSLSFGYENGRFSDFQYQSVITCLPKEGKDRRHIGNWRPISLLNTDIKIASAAIANRLKKVLPFIISDTQNGFIKGRFIGENTRLLYDLMHYLEYHNMSGLLLLVDFEKAFDSIDWIFLKKALNSFNFGPSMGKWFETFYCNAKSCIINNGHLSDFFSLERGCRQGDPLSPYIFIIGVELLSLKLKSSPNINSLHINNKEILLSQYADDTFLTLDGSEKSLLETLSCFDSFFFLSGLKMNPSKTRAIWIGSKKYSDHILCPNYNLLWSHSNFKLLGIEFSLDLDSMVKINYAKKIKEVSAILKSWQHRKLSLMGKITVIKTLALPKLVHLLTALPNLSQPQLNSLNTLFYNFIWNGHTDRIKRNTLIGDFSQGGLNMVHLYSFNIYLKLSWVKRFLLNPDGNWQHMLLFEFQKFGGARVFIFQKEKLEEVSTCLKNCFWRDVLFGMSKAKPIVKLDMKDMLSLDILNFVSVSDFAMYIKWKDVGIQYLHDIVDTQNASFLTFHQVKEKLNNNNFLLYYSLLSRIPRFIKDYIKEHCKEINISVFIPVDGFTEKMSINKKIKFIYTDLVNNIFIYPHEKFFTWETTLNVEISDFKKYFNTFEKML